MHGQEESTSFPRTVMTTLHAAFWGISVWYLGRDGWWNTREFLFLAAGGIYWLRTCLATYVFIKRKISWSEVIPVSFLFGIAHLGFAALVQTSKPLDWLSWTAVGLYVVGSYLHTASEGSRWRWKQNPNNKGKVYTEGWFRYSMHINYFGDTLLILGWALLTGSLWACILPLLVTLGFIFKHIPELDAYLATRYGQPFEEYAKRTKKLIPFVY